MVDLDIYPTGEFPKNEIDSPTFEATHIDFIFNFSQPSGWTDLVNGFGAVIVVKPSLSTCNLIINSLSLILLQDYDMLSVGRKNPRKYLGNHGTSTDCSFQSFFGNCKLRLFFFKPSSQSKIDFGPKLRDSWYPKMKRVIVSAPQNENLYQPVFLHFAGNPKRYIHITLSI